MALVDDNGNIWCDETAEVGRIVGGAMELDPNGHEMPGTVSRDRVGQLSEAYDGTVLVAMEGRQFLYTLTEKELTCAPASSDTFSHSRRTARCTPW